ncbi:MAG: hypothetical protein R3Y13_03030 [bacterium]
MSKKNIDKIIRIDDKKLKIITTVINIIMFIIVLLTLFTNIISINWYWLFITIYLLIDVINITHWDCDGLNINKKDGDKITIRYKDITAITMFISSLFYLIVLGFELYNESIRENIYVILTLYILLSTSQILNNIAKNNSKKDIEKLVKKTFKK